MAIYAYTNYELVKVRQEYEYRPSYFFYAGQLISNHLFRRPFETRTWEATPTDAIPGAAAQYNHDQQFPGPQNPGNLSEADGWRLLYVDYGKNLSQPMSKRVQEVWIKYGEWVDLGEQVPPAPTP